MLYLAGRTESPRPHALVLGPLVSARPIALQLDRFGFEPVFSPIRLPQPGASGAVEGLRAVLEEFVRVAGPATGRTSHIVHPGASPWADRPELAHLCQELGLGALCPPARVLSLFSNTLTLLTEADRLKIPHLVLSFDPIFSQRELDQVLGSSRKFPWILKSVRPVGAGSLLVVQDEDDLKKRFPLWMEQLRIETGEAIAFAERYVESARQVKLPFARFHDGRIEFFPTVEGSLQSRNRRIVELCPAGGLEGRLQKQLESWAKALAESTGFIGVGSFDFLVDGVRPFLLGGLCRLGTTFHLWEQVAGTQAVGWQLETFLGQPQGKSPLKPIPSGVSFRMYAEDPMLQLPQPGYIQELSPRREWKLAGASGELTWNFEAGQSVPFDDSGLLAIGYAGAADRRQALHVARGMLDEIWIAGSLRTNQRYLAELVMHPWVREGVFHAGFVDEEFLPDSRPSGGEIKLFAAVAAWWTNRKSVRQAEAWTVPYWIGDRWIRPEADVLIWDEDAVFWKAPLESGSDADTELFGLSGRLKNEDGRSVRLCLFPLADDRWLIRIGEWALAVRRAKAPAPKLAVAQAGGSPPARRVPQVSALVSGRVHALLFREGAAVAPHETLVLIESLRTLVPHAVPRGFLLKHWHVAADQLVTQGQPLADLEGIGSTE